MRRRANSLLRILVAVASTVMVRHSACAGSPGQPVPEDKPTRLGELPVRFGAGSEVAPDLAGTKLYVYGEAAGAPLREAVASLFGYEWRTAPGALPDGPALRLEQTPERRALPAKLRAEAARDAERELRDRLDGIRDVVARKEGSVDRLIARYPEDARWFGQGAKADDTLGIPPSPASPQYPADLAWYFGGARMAPILGALTQVQLASLLNGGVWMSPRLDNPNDPFDRVVRASYPGPTIRTRMIDRNGKVTAEQRIGFYDNPADDIHLVLAVCGRPDTPGIRGGVMRLAESVPPPGPYGSPRLPMARGDWRPNEVVLPAGTLRTGGPLKRDDPRLKQPARLFSSAQTVGVSYGGVLGRIAEVSGMSIVSDAYTSYLWARLPPGEFTAAEPLDQVLDRVTGFFQTTWRLEHDTLIFRHPHWYYEEAAEIPDALLERTAAAIRNNGGLSLDDLQFLADRLDRYQFRGLAAYYADLKVIVARHHAFWFYRSLTPAQRDLALNGGLPFSALNPRQQAAFLEVTRSERPQRLILPPAARGEWRLLLRRWQDPEGWDVGYEWGGSDFIAVLLPESTPIDPTKVYPDDPRRFFEADRLL